MSVHYILVLILSIPLIFKQSQMLKQMNQTCLTYNQILLTPYTSVKAIPIPTSNSTIVCDVSTGVPRPYVPEKFRQAVFESLHSLSHPSIRATQWLITARFVWPHINSDIRKWTKSCLQCQKSKILRHTQPHLLTLKYPMQDLTTFTLIL